MNDLDAALAGTAPTNPGDKERIRLVAISGASNVLGVCNNLQKISRIVHHHGARLLVDAAQLVVRKGLLKFSEADRELIRQSGEENAGGIAALGKALLLLKRIGPDLIREEERILTARALRALANIPGLRVYGVKDPESPALAQKTGVIPFDFGNIMPSKVARYLAQEGGIGVRSGCHCAYLIIKHLLHISPFLEQVQRLIQILFPKFRFLGVVRVSLGIENTEADIDTLIRVLEKFALQSKK
jgi:selenocysteine lyase/cysteine desulfurase